MSDTNDTSETLPVGNTKNVQRARYWMFTWNNYPEDYLTQLTIAFATAERYNFQPEVGEEKKTPHIQGFVAFKNARTFSSMTKLVCKEVSWRSCKSAAGEAYSMKEETRAGPLTKKGYAEKRSLIKDFHDWQLKLLDIIACRPHDRKIYWIIDEVGGRGKTTFCKHLILQDIGALYVTGKAGDIKYGITEFVGQDYDKLKIVLIDYTRSIENYVSYEAIEAVKNGIFYNTKYESKQVLFEVPHVFCFANFTPHVESMSADRWEIITL